MSSFLRRIKDKVDDTTILKNGAILLEKLITSGIGKRNPIKSFSARELNLATNNYDEEKFISTDGYYRLYKGFLKRPFIVMKFEESGSFLPDDYFFNNIVFASQVYHKNILKLIGCCLETKVPILVFESVECCSLDDWIHRPHQLNLEPLLLRHRLKVAMEIANAVAYLHFGLPRPIVFRDLKPSNILLDEHYVAKLYDFSLSVSIPEGETHVEDHVLGTIGFAAPEYIRTGELNEMCDVYSFGSLLLVLLRGRQINNFDFLEQEDDSTKADNAKADDSTVSDYVPQFLLPNRILNYFKKHIENNMFSEIVDPIIVGEASFREMRQQLQDLMQLISKCINLSAEDRPTMIDVAKQLRQMYLSVV